MKKVIHLVGGAIDHGGVLSVVRNVSSADSDGEYEHAIWVHEGFEQVREPKLTVERTRHDPRVSFAKQVFGSLRRLRRQVEDGGYDVVHCHDRHPHLLGALLALVTGKHVVATIHFYAKRKWLYRLVERVPRFHTVLLTPAMARHYGMMDVPVVPDCCADAWFEGELEEVETAFSRERKLRLRGIGVLIEWKGWHVLVEAVGMLSAEERAMVDVEVIGQASPIDAARAYAAGLERRVGELGLDDVVRFSGFVTDVREKLEEADWMVLPSVNEPCAVAISEALASGTPVVVTRSGGSVDTVQDGENGVMIDVGDAEGLAEKIRWMLGGGKLELDAAGIRESARERSASYVKGKLYELYAKWPHRRASGTA